MNINSRNISAFIQYLYQKRLQQDVSEEVLNSWTGLNDAEVQQYLSELFASWNYTEQDIDQEIQLFAASQTPDAIPTPAEQAFVPEPVRETPPVREQRIPPVSAPVRKKRSKAWIFILLLPLLALSVYVLYQYKQFKSLHYLYVTTNNVTIRDGQGAIIGRMDIYPKNNSVSYLRTTDRKLYPITVKDKQYACRRVVFDSTRFSDFFWKKPESFGYVNENYVIEDKDNFLIYRNVFKETNSARNESASLLSAYRKVIVGSIKQDQRLRKCFIVNTCNNSNKAYTAIIKQKLPDHQYGVVAQLSDGGYYMFYGNPETETYEAPKPLQYKTAFTDTYTDFKNENALFKLVDGTYFLFNCDGTAKEYYTKFDSRGRITYLKYAMEP